MPLDLTIPYADKEQAKKLGAFWLQEPGGAFIQNACDDQPSKISFETIELGKDYHINAAYLVANILWIDKRGVRASSQNLAF